MAESDPFTKVYDALWTMLEAHAGLAALVKAGNRIKYTGDARSPDKAGHNAADVPELRIIPTGGVPHIQRTSSSSSCTKRFEIQLSTGDQRVDAALFPVEWEVYRAMRDWAAILQALTWSDKAFVKLARPIDISEGVSNADLNRGIVGWSAIWACEVELWFTTSDL